MEEDYIKSPLYYQNQILSMMTDNDIQQLIGDKLKEKQQEELLKKEAIKWYRWNNRKIIELLYNDYISDVQKIINKFNYLLRQRRWETEDIDLWLLKKTVELTNVMFAFWVKVNKTRYNIKCPFPDHKDSSPSFKIYWNNFKCFWCGRSWSQIDFIIWMTWCSLKDAIKKFKEFN